MASGGSSTSARLRSSCRTRLSPVLPLRQPRLEIRVAWVPPVIRGLVAARVLAAGRVLPAEAGRALAHQPARRAPSIPRGRVRAWAAAVEAPAARSLASPARARRPRSKSTMAKTNTTDGCSYMTPEPNKPAVEVSSSLHPEPLLLPVQPRSPVRCPPHLRLRLREDLRLSKPPRQILRCRSRA